MNSKSIKPYFYILLLFSAIFWGASFVFTKYLLHDFSPVSIIYIRTTVSGIFLLIFSILFLKSYLKIRKKDIKVILAFSFFEPFLYFIFETYSLQYTSSSIVSVILLPPYPFLRLWYPVIILRKIFPKRICGASSSLCWESP